MEINFKKKNKVNLIIQKSGVFKKSVIFGLKRFKNGIVLENK